MKLFTVFLLCVLIQVISACSLHADKLYFENLDTKFKGVQYEKDNFNIN